MFSVKRRSSPGKPMAGGFLPPGTDRIVFVFYHKSSPVRGQRRSRAFAAGKKGIYDTMFASERYAPVTAQRGQILVARMDA